VGRHRLRPRDHERHALHRVRSSRSVPDRIIAEALATSRGSRGCSAGYVVNVGRSHLGSYAGEACSASGRGVSGLLSTKRRKTCPFCAFDGFAEISVGYLE
jgi:hypothetical protein